MKPFDGTAAPPQTRPADTETIIKQRMNLSRLETPPGLDSHWDPSRIMNLSSEIVDAISHGDKAIVRWIPSAPSIIKTWQRGNC